MVHQSNINWDMIYLIWGSSMILITLLYKLQSIPKIVPIFNLLFNWHQTIDYLICGILGFGVRFFQDRKKEPKPDFGFQLICSATISYLAYWAYIFFKIHFTPIEIWISILSWLGAFIFTTGDFITKNGILIYFRKLAEDFLRLTKEK